MQQRSDMEHFQNLCILAGEVVGAFWLVFFFSLSIFLPLLKATPDSIGLQIYSRWKIMLPTSEIEAGVY